jgi:hypothetical protein
MSFAHHWRSFSINPLGALVFGFCCMAVPRLPVKNRNALRAALRSGTDDTYTDCFRGEHRGNRCPMNVIGSLFPVVYHLYGNIARNILQK